ncbi:ArnT family glycosyltransferase [Teredinibacter franksiae]|uniref:ArnT family glycosyltransferase n=1 Tax=Teredinibacter franksiae TaxID=2761453 RepID=UPI00162924FD|nr:glycosyltransferase family 39 protein [Teredinibacter franksiae]
MQNFSLQIRRLLSSPLAIYISVGLSFFLGLGSVPLFDLDEGAFTEATREMLESGVFSATYLDGEPRYDKPIFFYWLQATSISLFGFNEWAFRLPSVMMACFWSYAVFSFSREFMGKHRGLIAALFLINSLWIALIARSAIADATLNVFLCLAIFDIWRYFKSPSTVVILRVYLWMALATLTKGPVGVVIPLLTSFLYLVSIRADKKLYLAYLNPLGWLVYVGTVAPWLIAVYLEQGWGFFEGFILEHNLKRFSATRESHGGSLLYYMAVLPLLVLPFTGQLGGIFGKLKQQLLDPFSRYLLIWFGVFFVIFSFSKTQLPHYILNGCVPLIILFARNKGLFSKARWHMVFPLAFMAILLALPHIIALAAESTKGYDGASLSRHLEVFNVGYTITAVIIFALMLAVSLLPSIRTWQRLVLSGLLLNVFVYTSFASVASGFQQAPVHQAIAFLKKRTETSGVEEPIVAWRMHMPSFSVYRQKITLLRPPQLNELVLTRVDRLNGLNKYIENTIPQAQAVPVWAFGGLVILKVLPSSYAMPQNEDGQ